jgi:hypothetical protein
MVRKIGKSRRYERVPQGLRSLTALLILREKIIRPLPAASIQPEPPTNLVTRFPSIITAKISKPGCAILYRLGHRCLNSSAIYFSNFRISN